MSTPTEKLLTTKQAADLLGITRVRVRQLIGEKVLAAVRLGRDLFIAPSDLRRARNRRGVGRPKKEA
jgi:excisionase family DNA binding protein